MTDRDRLIELLEQAKTKAQDTIGSMNNGFGAWYADYLIANGVIVLPCKAGTILKPDDYDIEKCVADHWDIVLVTRLEGTRLPYIMALEEVEEALERSKGNA